MNKIKSHYNKNYFQVQRLKGKIGGQLNLFKFQEFIKPRDTVLDFGCGGGYLLTNLHCKSKIGIEINEVATKECLNNGLSNIYTSTKAISSNSVDVVFSNHSMEHIPNPIDLLKDLNRVLKSGGKIILVTPYDDIKKSSSYCPDERNHHFYTWNPQNIGNCLYAAGFTNISSRVLYHSWPSFFALEISHFLPASFFRILCYTLSILKRKRQIWAYAEKVQ